ncbi:MAG: hypothetical protein RIT27_1771 [Pseudomonadota bacterium]
MNVTNEQEFWAFMAKLSAEQDRRHAQLARTNAQTDEKIKALVEQIARTDEQLAKTDAQLAKTDAQLAKTDAKLNKVAKLFGDVNNNRGEEAEEFFFHSLRKHPQIGGIQFDTVHRNLSGSKGKISDEFDLVLVNGDALALVEVKTKAHIKLIDQILERKIPRLKTLFPAFKHYKIYAGIASLVTYPELVEKITEQGLFLLTQQGKHLEIINPPLQHF